MPSGIAVIDRIVIAVTVQVQAVDGGGVEVGSVVRADEAAPLRAVISGIAVVQAGFFVVVVTTVTNGVGFCDRRVAGNSAVTPSVIDILGDQIAIGIVNTNHIAQRIPMEIVGSGHTTGGILHTDDGVAVIQEDNLFFFIGGAVVPCYSFFRRSVCRSDHSRIAYRS